MAAITRKQFRDAVETILEAQRTATPTLLRKTFRHHPGGLSGEKPLAWMGEITDDLGYDSGTRSRIMTTESQIATTFPADLPTDEFDDLMDALIERFTSNYRIIPNTVLELTRIEPTEVSIARAGGGEDIYRGAVLSVRLRIWEGRI